MSDSEGQRFNLRPGVALVISIFTVAFVVTGAAAATAASKGTRATATSTTVATVPVAVSTTTTAVTPKSPPAAKAPAGGTGTTTTTQATKGATKTPSTTATTTSTTTAPKSTTTTAPKSTTTTEAPSKASPVTTSPTPAPAETPGTPLADVKKGSSSGGVGASKGDDSAVPPETYGSAVGNGPSCGPAPTFVTGETFHANGCYTVPANGIKISANDVTIIGGTWNDASTESCPFTKCSPEDIHGRASITVTGTDDTLQNMTVAGVDTGPWPVDAYHPDLAANDGIDLRGSATTTLINDRVHNVFGTCLDIGPDHFPLPGWTTTTNLTVTGFAATDCGLQGIAPVALDHGTFTDVTIGAVSQSTWDFEDDSLGEKAKNVTITDCTYDGLVNIASHADGAITFTDCTMPVAKSGDAVSVGSLRAAPIGPITFDNDSLKCLGEAELACINVRSGVVNLTDTSITVGGKNEKLYTAIDGSSLGFSGVTVTGPHAAGTHDLSSAVTGAL